MKTISIITPTYNSMRTLTEFIDALTLQDYPHLQIEIIFIDGGSTDGTIDFINKIKQNSDIEISIYNNSLKTAEAGKAIGVKKAKGEIICFLDSDNILPDSNWISLMTTPFKESDVIASEPIKYIYRREDSVVNRYCALIGMNDPLCMFIGNYDRYCTITNTWTNINREEIDKGSYLLVKFKKGVIPTIGANGFLIKRKELINSFDGDYLFDIDILYELLNNNSSLQIAKVKTGIIHLYCPDTKTFIRKQNRRIKDYLYFNNNNNRKYPWSKVSKGKILLFILSCITIIPLIIQIIIGEYRKQDIKAWMYHIVACLITLFVYGWGVISGMFNKTEANRNEWKQ